MKKRIKAFFLSPLFGIQFKEVEDSLDVWYHELSCEMIEIHNVDIGGRRFEMICDEEARLRNGTQWISAVCDNIFQKTHIIGKIAVTGAADDEGNLTSLTEDDYDLILRHVETHLGIKNNYERFPIVQLMFHW